ncbi:bifunctional ADP-dependent NAD(P)H-hydrate dehydratase/NAD(P)H-hydrate epimerase [Algicola sagamiensis]|uniref:bifunctional ADP-dependent NAD(P)H-hydrate dehydratase/NAD(P)H-hydrate epimerase n=1 Tax=Algicola sagamiensis TaxID=163869 RepID=UPI00037E7943|nr:bifunctional ADP-dependent NAD(P)H-hydrate dehydratase/NAD(P)H-hydrate epimerase [Algicola sagamiensis]
MKTITTNLPRKLYRAEQIRENEADVAALVDIQMYPLMVLAGQAVVDCALMHAHENTLFYVICGTGNNGGDGYVVARCLDSAGRMVEVIQTGDVEKIKGEAKQARDAWLVAGGKESQQFPQKWDSDAMIIDALLGTGLTGDLREEHLQCIERMNTSGRMIISVDVPSGLNANCGQPMPDAVEADMTVTFIALKRGLVTGFGPHYSGQIYFAGLGLNKTFEKQVESSAQFSNAEQLIQQLKPRAKFYHKGMCGKVVLVGGNKGMPGAIRLAAESALRCGAGLVSVLTHPDNIAAVVSSRPELMVQGIEDGEEATALLEAADVIVVGPGLGQDNWAISILRQILDLDKYRVMDADALNLIAFAPEPVKLRNTVITPHPGEAARLLKKSTQDVESDRFSAAKQLQQQHQAVTVLKGAGSIIASESQCLVNHSGNPGMATAGMGDVLSGIIGAFVGQGMPLEDAAALGVYLHGAAADLASSQGQRGMIASDLFPYLRQLVNPESAR